VLILPFLQVATYFLTAEYDLSQKIMPFLDVHMSFPLVSFLEQRQVCRLDFRVRSRKATVCSLPSCTRPRN
jgi:hypothetical protein